MQSCGTFTVELQFYNVLVIFQVILLNACFRRYDLASVYDNGAVFQLELKGTWFAKFFKNGICIGYTRDFDVDTVRTFLVNLCFCAVAVNTLLQLVNRVFHIFGRRILITHYLICDTYTAGQVQTKCDVFGSSRSGRSEADSCGVGQKPKKQGDRNDYTNRFVLFHVS